MKILVVNDDGYQSEGLYILADAFRKYGEVLIVSPHYGQSGASSSITVEHGLVVHSHGKEVYSVEGTPSDCVKFGLFGLNWDADLVVSGVNNGFNIGIDTIYSGTIGAAMEALFHNKKALAFSCDYNAFEIAKREIDTVVDYLFTHEIISSHYVLNVNFPQKKFPESMGIEICDLGIRGFEIHYLEEDGKMKSHRTFYPYEVIEKTDLWAYKYGYTSITPLKLGNGDHEAYLNLIQQIETK